MYMVVGMGCEGLSGIGICVGELLRVKWSVAVVMVGVMV